MSLALAFLVAWIAGAVGFALGWTVRHYTRRPELPAVVAVVALRAHDGKVHHVREEAR